MSALDWQRLGPRGWQAQTLHGCLHVLLLGGQATAWLNAWAGDRLADFPEVTWSRAAISDPRPWAEGAYRRWAEARNPHQKEDSE